MDLASIANWADDVRTAAAGRGLLRDDPEAGAFNEKFPTNALWHFVDLPLGTKDYHEFPRTLVYFISPFVKRPLL